MKSLYFNRQGSQQTGWRMLKKGKQVVFDCSLALVAGLVLAQPAFAQEVRSAEVGTVRAVTLADTTSPWYPETSYGRGATLTIPIQGAVRSLTGTRFSLVAGENPAFSTVYVDGGVRVTVSSKETPGTVLEVRVSVTYSDNSSEEVPIRVTVKSQVSDNNKLTYEQKTVIKGEQTFTMPATNTDGNPFPEGTRFSIYSRPNKAGMLMKQQEK